MEFSYCNTCKENMEVTNMYVEAAGMGATAPVTTATVVKPVTPSETENTVNVETMEGDSQQTEKSEKSATYDERKDMRTPEEKAASDKEKIKKAIEKMNAQLPESEVKFGIHEKTERVTIKLVNKSTKEVIKEFPAEKTLDMIAKCMEIAGVLVDEKL